MARKNWKQFHDEKEKGNQDTGASDNAHSRLRLHHPERKARRGPAEGGSHGADFRHRNKQRIAEKQAHDGGDGDAEDGDRRRLKIFVNAAENRWNRLAAAIGEKQAAGCDKVSVKALEESKEGH